MSAENALYVVLVVFHTLCAAVAVGAVSVTDYVHLVGLRKRSLDKRLLIVYPHLSRVILYSLLGIIFSGLLIVKLNSAILKSALFQLKLFLFAIVLVNGAVLQMKVFPEVKKHTAREQKFPQRLVLLSSLTGSISLVTWYAIFILSLTKNLGYSARAFLLAYALALLVSFAVAFYLERKRAEGESRTPVSRTTTVRSNR